MARTRIIFTPPNYGKTTVGKIAPSTGIYGKRVSGTPTQTAVRIRGRRK